MAGQTPQSEQYIPVYTEGQKVDLTPHLGFDPAIGAVYSRLHGGAKGGSDPASGVRPRNRITV